MSTKTRTFTLLLASAALMFGTAAFAGPGDNPECLGDECGKPKEEGGGCGCGCGCSVWVAYTDDGKTLSYTDDSDGDGKADDKDNCPFAANRDQLDSDGDGVGDVCDNCADVSNYTQLDTDGDKSGDVCDADIDGDGVANAADNCQSIPNSAQANADGDAQGDACDADDDNDGVADGTDNCPLVANANQVIPSGVTCNVDADSDSVGDSFDNCPGVANPNQKDTDADGIGDVCDSDTDNDGILNAADNCALVANRSQADDDGDLKGDACDDKYCVVVDPAHPADCLDPKGSFSVNAGGAVTLKTGEKFQPRIFANRESKGILYEWTVTSRPEGSTAAVSNPKGSVTLSRHWQYAYQDGQVPTFTADRDGVYTLQLSAKLAFADRAYPANDTASSTLTLDTQGGSAGKTGCAAIPVGAPLFGLSLLALGFIRRRRA